VPFFQHRQSQELIKNCRQLMLKSRWYVKLPMPSAPLSLPIMCRSLQQSPRLFGPCIESEFQKIGDSGLALLKDFAKNYNSMSDEKATDLTSEALQLEQKRVKLQMSYAKKFRKVVSPAKVFRIFQIENRINAVSKLKLASEIPLMK